MTTRLLLQASSGAGKSWALRQLLEETHGRVQQLVLDPEGEFATLRERFDYVIGAARDADVVTHPKTARVLCRRLMELGASAVLDLYELKKPDRRAFVRLFLDELISLPRTLWHPTLIVLDEAHDYCPEKGHGEAESAESVIGVSTKGRKRGFCLVAATQRIAKFNKDAAADLMNKMIGRTGLDVDVKRAGDELGFGVEERKGLRLLEDGEFFVYGPAISPTIQRVRTGKILTTHPEPGTLAAATPPPPRDKVKVVLRQLDDLAKAADEEARTLADLQRKNAELTQQVKRLEKGVPVIGKTERIDPGLIDRAVAAARREQAGTIATLQKALDLAMKLIVRISTANFDVAGVDKAEIEKAIGAAVDRAMKLAENQLTTRSGAVKKLQTDAARILAELEKVRALPEEITVDVSVRRNEPFTVVAPKPNGRPPVSRITRDPVDGDGSLSSGERKVLNAAAQYPEGASREQLSILVGLKRSTRDRYIQYLQQKGMVTTAAGGGVVATDAGIAALGSNFEPLPTGAALREYWLQQLPEGESRILAHLIDAYPEAVPRDALTEAIGLQRSTRDRYLQYLQARKLVTTERGAARASDILFE